MRIAFGLGFAAASIIACSGDDDPLFVSVTPQTQQALSATVCSKVHECLGDFATGIFYSSVASCQSRFAAQYGLDVLSPGYGVSESAASACNSALATATCNDVIAGVVPAACQFTGSLAAGAACTADAECTTGSCFIDDAASCGRCAARVANGGDCTSAACERGLKCNGNHACTNGQAGAACTKDGDCATPGFSCRQNVCTAWLPADATCVYPNDNAAPCDVTKSLFCIPEKLSDTTGTCKAVASKLAGDGQVCGLTLAPLTITACTGGECLGSECEAYLADGVSCDGTRPCQAPATCRNGVCSLKDSAKCR